MGHITAFGDEEMEPRKPAYCDSCANLFSIGCPSNYQLAGVELCPYYVPNIGQGREAKYADDPIQSSLDSLPEKFRRS